MICSLFFFFFSRKCIIPFASHFLFGFTKYAPGISADPQVFVATTLHHIHSASIIVVQRHSMKLEFTTMSVLG